MHTNKYTCTHRDVVSLEIEVVTGSAGIHIDHSKTNTTHAHTLCVQTQLQRHKTQTHPRTHTNAPTHPPTHPHTHMHTQGCGEPEDRGGHGQCRYAQQAILK